MLNKLLDRSRINQGHSCSRCHDRKG